MSFYDVIANYVVINTVNVIKKYDYTLISVLLRAV
ncbi:hypothetical protein FHX77_000058 [Bifidobacterium commune]|nr:hypothetical protein [Bifidobacterium commune]